LTKCVKIWVDAEKEYSFSESMIDVNFEAVVEMVVGAKQLDVGRRMAEGRRGVEEGDERKWQAEGGEKGFGSRRGRVGKWVRKVENGENYT
jgi:hypothetical protein